MGAELVGILIAMTTAIAGFITYMGQRYGIGNQAMAAQVELQQKVNARFDTIQSEYVDLKVMTSTQEATIKILRRDLDREKGKTETARREQALAEQSHKQAQEKSTKEIATLSAEVSNLRRDVMSIGEELTKARKEKAALVEEKDLLETRLADSDADNASLAERVKLLETQQNSMRDDVMLMRETHAKEVALLNQQIEEKDKLIKTLEAKLDAKNSSGVVGGGDGADDGGVARDGTSPAGDDGGGGTGADGGGDGRADGAAGGADESV